MSGTKNISSITSKIRRRAEGLSTKYTFEDLKEFNRKANEEHIKEINSNIKRHQMEETTGRSGILPLHQGCTFDNFDITDIDPQVQAKKYAVREWCREYAYTFNDDTSRGFIFGGTTGTGKNHMAAAICNDLMPRGYSCLVITVNELMIQLRASYDTIGEDKFIKNMIDFDLLVLDEIGLQRKNDNEKLTINTIIDQRIGRMKPTGMLTNLRPESSDANEETMATVVGTRIMSRMRMNGGKWKSFVWEDYRK